MLLWVVKYFQETRLLSDIVKHLVNSEGDQ